LERCDNPGDWLRKEIEAALGAKRNIIPILLEGFDYSSPAINRYLTGSLVALKKYNCLRVPSDYFDAAMDRLHSKFLNIELDAVLHPLSPPDDETSRRQQSAADCAPPVHKSELSAQEWLEKAINSPDRVERIRLLGEALQINCEYADAYKIRGATYLEMGLLPKALEDLNEAIRLNPKSADAYVARGLANDFLLDDPQRAISEYDYALNLDQNSADAYFARAKAYRRMNDLDHAICDYTNCLALRPNDDEAYNNRGAARATKGDLSGALSDYEAALKIKPTKFDSHYNRAYALGRSGDLDGAIQGFTNALELHPEAGDAHDLANVYVGRGIAFTFRNDLDKALDDFCDAIRLNPYLAEAYKNRAAIREARGEYAAAADDIERYLELDYGMNDNEKLQFKRVLEDFRGKATKSRKS
jgi:tetratricopeptide (TPR) repeat protein